MCSAVSPAVLNVTVGQPRLKNSLLRGPDLNFEGRQLHSYNDFV